MGARAQHAHVLRAAEEEGPLVTTDGEATQHGDDLRKEGWRGLVCVGVRAGPDRWAYRFDPQREEARTARLAVDAAMLRQIIEQLAVAAAQVEHA